MSNNINITVYFVGNTAQDAADRSPWDDWTDADEFRQEMGFKHVYVGTGTITVDDLEVCD